jgi:iron complex transport system substrate-binding protein
MRLTAVRVWSVASCFVLWALLAACAGDGNGDPNGDGPGSFGEPTTIEGVSTIDAFPLQISRSDAKTLTVDGPPERIVSLSPGATETLFAIGAQDAIVAVDNNADYPQAAANFPTKVDAFEPNLESIVALDPDLVIVPNNQGGIVEALDGLSIPVLYQDIDTSITSIGDVFTQVALLGRVTGHQAEAEALLTALDLRVDAIVDGVQGLSQATSPKIYHELDSTFFTVSENSFIGDLYNTLHARNIAGDGGGVAYPQLTQEAIIAANPDVIILADEEFGVTIESVEARPGWDAIAAVVEGRIVGIDPDIVSRPGPRIVDALELLAKAIYPTRFN